MPANPQHVTLTADVEETITLDSNCGTVEILVVANPAVIYFNTKNVAVPAVASDQTGNRAVPAAITHVEVPDETSGENSIVRMRSAGTPTVMVTGR